MELNSSNSHWYHAYIGALQYAFVLNQGLQKEMKYLDIGCGPFRAGKLIVEYLDDENYYGIDRFDYEMDTKRKYFYKINDQFELYNEKFDMIMAWSVFTHLLEEQIDKCLSSVREVMNKDCRFFATYFPPRNGYIGKVGKNNFCYEYNTIQKLAKKNRMEVKNVDVNKFLHSNRNQTMLVFVRK